jgi:mannose-6-phosphate isomerase
MSIQLLEPKFVERVWGTTRLTPLFPDQPTNVGEVWFDAGAGFPLLVKFIFTAARLSVQVHPDDSYARAAENSRGKTEMWHILQAAPDSTIALGFREPQSKEAVRDAIAGETVEGMLNWVPVKAGDSFLAEAGTVHAIGAGIVLCEIQQNSDVTYRLYDYGRPRELHLEKGMAVANTEPYDGLRNYPISCAHFHVDLLELTEATDCVAGCDGVLVVLEGSGEIGDTPVQAGQVALITADTKSAPIKPAGTLKVLHARCGAET